MGKYNLLKSNFSSGELSPKLEGRSDIKEYNQGLALFENFHTMKSGGASKRQGLRYQGTISNMVDPVAIPFEVSKTETYVILIDTNGATPSITPPVQVMDSNGAFQSVSSGSVVFPKTIDRDGFYFTQSADVIFITHTSSDFKPIFIARTPAIFGGGIVFSVSIWTGTLSNPYTNSSSQFALPTYKKFPYLDENIDPEIRLRPSATTGDVTLHFENSAAGSISFLTADHIGSYFKIKHATVPVNTGVCVVTGVPLLETAFAAGTVNVGTDTINVTHGRLTGDKVYIETSGTMPAPIQQTSAVQSIPYYIIRVDANNFQLAHTKAEAIALTAINITSQGVGTHQLIDATGTQVASGDITIVVDFTATTASDDWQESAWSYYQGWPKCNTMYESRLCWGGSSANPDFIWMGRSGNLIELMSEKLVQDATTTTDDDPLFFALGSDRVPQIQWMSGGNTLQVGTFSTEYIISGGDNPISALGDSIHINPQTAHGGVAVRPYRTGNTLLFVGRDAKRIRNYIWNSKNGSYISQNLNVLSDDIVMNAGSAAAATYSNVAIKHLAYQASAGILWVLTDRNVLLSLTYDVDSQTIAWARHSIGGVDAKVHGIAAIANKYGDSDELWISISRTINSATVYYIEKLGVDFNNPQLNGQFTSENDLPFYSDSSIRLTDFGNAKTAWSGLGHLEGETVKVLADGVLHADLVVTAGAITTASPVEEIIVGLVYTAKLNSLDLDAGADFDSASGNKSRIDRLYLQVYNSYGGKIGRDSSNIEDIEYFTSLNNPLFSGGIAQSFNGTPDEAARVYVEHSDPLPFNLLTLTMRGVSYD